MSREFVEFANLKILWSVVEGESHQGGDFVESLSASGAGVDVQEFMLWVIHHLQNMGMSSDEDVRMVVLDDGEYCALIVSRVAAYVSHENLVPLSHKQLGGRKFPAYILTVHVAVNTHHRFECPQRLQHAWPEVAGMPYLVAFFKKRIHLLWNGAMCVR